MSPSVFIFLQDLLYFQQLKQYVVEYDMLVDSLITKVTYFLVLHPFTYFMRRSSKGVIIHLLRFSFNSKLST